MTSTLCDLKSGCINGDSGDPVYKTIDNIGEAILSMTKLIDPESKTTKAVRVTFKKRSS